MPASFVSATFNSTLATDTTLSVDRPGASVAGDLLLTGFLSIVGGEPPATHTPPAGFTELIDDEHDTVPERRFGLAWKIDDGAEPAFYTWTRTGLFTSASVWMARFTDVAAMAINAHDFANVNNATGAVAFSCPGVIATVTGLVARIEHGFKGDPAAASAVGPAGTTERIDHDYPGGAFPHTSLYTQDAEQSPGAVPAADITVSIAGETIAGWAVTVMIAAFGAAPPSGHGGGAGGMPPAQVRKGLFLRDFWEEIRR